MYLSKIEIPAGGRLLVGHVSTSTRDDPDVPIPVHEYTQDYAGDLIQDSYCGTCDASSQLDPVPKDGAVLVLIVHQDGCGTLARHLGQLGDTGTGSVAP